MFILEGIFKGKKQLKQDYDTFALVGVASVASDGYGEKEIVDDVRLTKAQMEEGWLEKLKPLMGKVIHAPVNVFQSESNGRSFMNITFREFPTVTQSAQASK